MKLYPGCPEFEPDPQTGPMMYDPRRAERAVLLLKLGGFELTAEQLHRVRALFGWVPAHAES